MSRSRLQNPRVVATTNSVPKSRGPAGDCRGGQGTARVISHDVKRIRLEIYDFSLASTGGPSAGTIVPYTPSGPHLPWCSPS